MFTYESFETAGAFTLLRPTFATLIIAVLGLFFIIVTPKLRKLVNSLTVLGLSILSIIVSGQLLFYNAIIVDEIGLGGDEITTYMFLFILFFSMLNLVVYFIKRT